jgi:hypothetical protein
MRDVGGKLRSPCGSGTEQAQDKKDQENDQEDIKQDSRNIRAGGRKIGEAKQGRN